MMLLLPPHVNGHGGCVNCLSWEALANRAFDERRAFRKLLALLFESDLALDAITIYEYVLKFDLLLDKESPEGAFAKVRDVIRSLEEVDSK